MAAEKAVNAALWAKVKRLYDDPDAKLHDIAALVGMAPIQLSNEARKRGWPKRSALPRRRIPQALKRTDGTPAMAEAAHAPAKPAKAGTAKPPRPIVLVHRVYDTINGELSKLELQRGATSQDRERASRALSQITNSLEKAVEMQRELTKAVAKGRGVKDKEALAHAEDLRRAIAERLERLQRQRSLGKRSGSAE